MHRRSVTLLEILIALALVLAMAAIVAPSLLESMDERAFETAADETNEQLMMARAHAQATGKPVEVTYNSGTSRVQARLLAQQVSSDVTEADSGDLLQEPWALRILGRGVRFVARAPKAAASDDSPPEGDDFADGEDFESLDDLGKGQDVRLAVFMPDGTTLLGDRVWLNDSNGRLGVFTINPWSGLPFFERLADLTQDAAKAEPQAPQR